MPEPLAAALAALRAELLDPERLIRAVAAGRRRGAPPVPRRAELRPVEIRGGRQLQVVTADDRGVRTRNVGYGEPAEVAVDRLLGEPFGNWRVELVDETVQLRVTKSSAAQVHRAPRAAGARPVSTAHDRVKPHLLDPGDPLFGVVGADAGKRRQVDAFLRLLAPVVPAVAEGPLTPLRVVDLGCGNAYLTFAAYRYLTEVRMLPAELVGVDIKAGARERNSALAGELRWAPHVRFVAGSIADVPAGSLGFADRPGATVDLVLALHACDTATDDAIARAVRWQAPVLLAAPCCHHDLQRQLGATSGPPPYRPLTRHGILRERFADLLTDALRAALLRLVGYRVDVVEFIESRHTPRNALIRAVRTGAVAGPERLAEYRALTSAWNVRPRLESLLADALP